MSYVLPMIPISKKISNELIDSATRMIEQAEHIVILTHISPDGDAMGSSLGMQQYLYALDKEDVTVVVPNAFPAFLHWMKGADKVLQYDTQQAEADLAFNQADLIICLDFNEAKRIGLLGERLSQVTVPILVIDHHLIFPEFATVAISYPESPSTCELLFRLICRMGNFNLVTKDMAECILGGMMTDSGNYSFNANDPDSYCMIANLLEKGADKVALYDRLFNCWSVERMRLMGYCLEHMIVDKKYHSALIYLTKETLRRHNFQSGDAEGLVNLPLQIEGIYYSCFMREDVDKIKISFRSQGDRDVTGIAKTYFMGGGHKNAAGGEFHDTIEAAVACFKSHYREFYQK